MVTNPKSVKYQIQNIKYTKWHLMLHARTEHVLFLRYLF